MKWAGHQFLSLIIEEYFVRNYLVHHVRILVRCVILWTAMSMMLQMKQLNVNFRKNLKNIMRRRSLTSSHFGRTQSLLKTFRFDFGYFIRSATESSYSSHPYGVSVLFKAIMGIQSWYPQLWNWRWIYVYVARECGRTWLRWDSIMLTEFFSVMASCAWALNSL